MKDKMFKHNKSHSSFFWKKFLIISCIVILFAALVAVPVSICVHVQSSVQTSLFLTNILTCLIK